MIGNSSLVHALALSKAITHVVDRVLDNPDVDLLQENAVAERRYDLTKPHQARLTKIVERVLKARAIIRHLADRYGLSASGRIADKQGLYRCMYNDGPYDRRFSAEPRSFVMAFHVSEDDIGPFAKAASYPSISIDAVLNHNMAEISRQHPAYFGLDSLTVAVSNRELGSMADDYLAHEIGHVVGSFVSPNEDVLIFDEVSSDLFARVHISGKIKSHELEEAQRLLKGEKNIHARMKKRTKSMYVLRSQQKEVKEYGEFLNAVKAIPVQHYRDLVNLGIDGRVLGVMLMLTPHHQVGRMLYGLERYLQKNPSAAEYQNKG
ncbi:hypothetical protein HYS47_01065 [Candidatus Woesearchaeota archaeon]|nr:hypothetical protein [Candidatus Woesearchaeota archaeon]